MAGHELLVLWGDHHIHWTVKEVLSSVEGDYLWDRIDWETPGLHMGLEA